MKSRTGVIIAVAGLSSRMQQFKPLLPLGGKKVIEHVVDCALAGNMDEIVVVVGKEAEKMKEVLRNRPVKLVSNPQYATSDMLTSIKIGIRALSKELNSFFVMPGDMPLVTPSCYQCLCREQERDTNIMVTQLRYQGSGGHPILIHQKCREHILEYEGVDGLKGALRSYEEQKKYLEWPESNILIDMDTAADYTEVKQRYEQRNLPERAAIFTMLQQSETPKEVIKHSIAVEKIALELGEKALQKGYPMNVNLIGAAALLHDVERRKKQHAVAGANLLERLGYPQLADVIREHMVLSDEAMEHIDERAIVYLADKLVEGEKITTVEERFQKKLDRQEVDSPVYHKIMKNKENAMQLAQLFWQK